MARKTRLERLTEDDAIAAANEGVELDDAATQAEILNPKVIDVPLEGGTSIPIQVELKLSQILERKVTQITQAMILAVQKHITELSGDSGQDAQWFARNITYVPLVAYKQSVQVIVADFLSALSGKPAADILPKVSIATVQTAFLTALQILTHLNSQKDGESEAPNVVKVA